MAALVPFDTRIDWSAVVATATGPEGLLHASATTTAPQLRRTPLGSPASREESNDPKPSLCRSRRGACVQQSYRSRRSCDHRRPIDSRVERDECGHLLLRY